MLWLFLAVFVFLNAYSIVYFHKCNKELREEVIKTRQWCREVINSIVEQEVKIDAMLTQVISDLKDNKVSNDVNSILESGKMCQYHMKVYSDLQEETDKLTSSIQNIRDEQTNMVKDATDKFNNYPGDN